MRNERALGDAEYCELDAGSVIAKHIQILITI